MSYSHWLYQSSKWLPYSSLVSKCHCPTWSCDKWPSLKNCLVPSCSQLILDYIPVTGGTNIYTLSNLEIGCDVTRSKIVRFTVSNPKMCFTTISHTTRAFYGNITSNLENGQSVNLNIYFTAMQLHYWSINHLPQLNATHCTSSSLHRSQYGDGNLSTAIHCNSDAVEYEQSLSQSLLQWNGLPNLEVTWLKVKVGTVLPILYFQSICRACMCT